MYKSYLITKDIREKRLKKLILVIIVILFISGCDNNKTNKQSNELTTIMNTKEYIIVDVRTKDEYDTSHIIGAINIPYNEINDDIIIDKAKTILVYCQSGNRSKIAQEALIKLGYETYDLGAFKEIDLPKK